MEQALEVYKICHFYQLIPTMAAIEGSLLSLLSAETAFQLFAFARPLSEALKEQVLDHIRVHAVDLFSTGEDGDPPGWLKLSQEEVCLRTCL